MSNGCGSKAKELAERQRRYDRLHHIHNLAWVNAPNPAWGCGKQMLPSEIDSVKRHAWRGLHEMVTRAVDLNDAEYLAELDAWEASPGGAAAIGKSMEQQTEGDKG
jgi:hypothetical protein